MSTKHTPEPWLASGEYVYGNTNPVGSTVDRPADAARIVACVNACAGLNPEHIPALVEAVQAVVDADVFVAMPRLRAALAAVRGTK